MEGIKALAESSAKNAVFLSAPLPDGLRRILGLHRKFAVFLENPTLTFTSHWKKIIPTLSWKTPTLSWKTPTLSLRVPCTEHLHRTCNERVGVFHVRVGIIFFSGRWGSVWGSSRRLQVPYAIPRPGVVRHLRTNVEPGEVLPDPGLPGPELGRRELRHKDGPDHKRWTKNMYVNK